MPADLMEKSSSSPVAATPASVHATPDKPRTASDHRKSSRHSKLEKADILEMTVKHLRGLQRAQMTAALTADPSVLGKYRAGFNECLNEVTRFLSTCEGVNAEVRTRLLGHLAACLGQINAANYPPPPPPPPPPAHGAAFGQPLGPVPAGAAPPAGGLGPCKLGASGGEAAPVLGGFQLVPAAEGQLAFLIPGASFGPPGGAVIPLYAGGGLGSPGLPPPAPSPAAGAPPLPADSVWRPW
ncbi:transcription factor HES-1 isoform X2 [Eublepharis macularius]|uniref:Transcription factor HES-1 isoform X2 n=1 Tax=Eublepharis macularius TaxID=481883 RepID=A0AA97JIC9_EUBMA|nr:transcription factor HES-1 isoform X2 [Eublepharis macularius]